MLAQQHVANSEIYEAIDEFKIYTILKPEAKSEYKEVISKLKSYINPEANIIAACQEEGDKLLSKSDYKNAKYYFARIMKLSYPNTMDFTRAKAKYMKCENEELNNV